MNETNINTLIYLGIGLFIALTLTTIAGIYYKKWEEVVNEEESKFKPIDVISIIAMLVILLWPLFIFYVVFIKLHKAWYILVSMLSYKITEWRKKR